MSNLISVRLSVRAEDKVETFRAYALTCLGIKLSRSAAINIMLERADIPRSAPEEAEDV